MRTLCVWIIQSYRLLISPMLGKNCRFEPSCSQYAIEALQRHGTVQGLGLVLVRLLKCHPFHPGGEDPVR